MSDSVLVTSLKWKINTTDPKKLLTSTGPNSHNISTNSSDRLLIAIWMGDIFPWSKLFAGAPFFSKKWQISILSSRTAQCITVFPEESVASKGSCWETKILIHSKWSRSSSFLLDPFRQFIRIGIPERE